MNHYIQLKKTNCKNCYKCIRHCPVKSIKFSDHQANIISDQCILCGECVVTCPQNAKQVKNDVGLAKEMIASNRPVYATIAPSFIASFHGSTIHSLEETLKKLGFAGISETALGATIVKRQYEGMISSSKSQVMISSCCHTVNSLIQKYYPEALAYLADVVSPMQASCIKIKEEHPEAYTIFIGPCISKKEEADQQKGMVDLVLTFEELKNWLAEEEIRISNPSDLKTATNQADSNTQEGRARLFPITGGIIRTMDIKDASYDFIAIDGLDNCKRALSDIINQKLTNCFIEMSACVGSCIGGPAMGKEYRSPITDYIAVNHYAHSIDFTISSPSKDKLKKGFIYLGHSNQMPGSTAIIEILHKMGKSSPEQELNCGSCGYDTCREKAIAVIQGKADLTMCLPFLKEKAENFSDNIIYNMPNGVLVLNEDLEVQQINRAAKQILNLRSKRDILGSPVVRILNPAPYLNVMTSGKNLHDKRVYLSEYQKYIEETIIYDKTYHIIISIMRDITQEETYRQKKENISKQSIEITDKVIEKQMRIVQEIASLLGETTAETKIALTSLKETLQNE